MGVFFKCSSSGKYDESKGLWTTYAVPLIDGVIRRFAKIELRDVDMIVDDGSEELERYDVEDVGDSLDEIVHCRLEREKMRRCFDSLCAHGGKPAAVPHRLRWREAFHEHKTGLFGTGGLGIVKYHFELGAGIEHPKWN